MGVDNNAILFLGIKLDDDLLKKLAKKVREKYKDEFNLKELTDEELINEELFNQYFCDKGVENIVVHTDNEYESPKDKLIGIKIADSGSYGKKEMEISKLRKEIKSARKEFKQFLEVEPKLYLFNYLW